MKTVAYKTRMMRVERNNRIAFFWVSSSSKCSAVQCISQTREWRTWRAARWNLLSIRFHCQVQDSFFFRWWNVKKGKKNKAVCALRVCCGFLIIFNLIYFYVKFRIQLKFICLIIFPSVSHSSWNIFFIAFFLKKFCHSLTFNVDF